MNRTLILCENDPVQRQALAECVDALQMGFEILPVSGAAQLQQSLSELRSVPILLMDIMLDDGEDGISLVKDIHRTDPAIPVIFMSAFLEKSCDVYETDHCYFVYKPQKEKRLRPALLAALQQLDRTGQPLLVHEGADLLRLDPEDILCLERVRRYTFITCRQQVCRVREDLDALLEQLPAGFHRCHRSYIVNFARCRAFRGKELEMENGMRVPVARSWQPVIREAFGRYLQKEAGSC